MPHKPSKKGGWVNTVTTDTVAVPLGTMTKEPEEMADILLAHNQYPGVHGSINRYIQFYLNRGGKGISKERYEKCRQAMEIIRKRKDASGS
jgi:hypothetical protein